MGMGNSAGLGGKMQKTRVAVFYYSRGGNTRKVAQAIAGKMGTEALDAGAVGEGYDLKKCDLLFAGSGNYGDSPGREMLRFIEGIVPAEDRYAAVFGTRGGESEAHLAKMRGALEGKGLRFLGGWSCPGQEYGLKNKGRPDEEDLEKARQFAEKILKKIEVI